MFVFAWSLLLIRSVACAEGSDQPAIDQPGPGQVSPAAPSEAGAADAALKCETKKASKKATPAFPGPKTLPPMGPYKPLFFDNDFSYKSNPDHEPVLGEQFKLVPLFCDPDVVFSTGGEIRHRFMDQRNRLQPGGPGRTDYHQWRWRHYGDLRAGEDLRFYVEGIHAESFGENLPIQPIDENQWDLLNAFVDLQVLTTGAGKHVLRAGRQELLFGRQRLISPLDWANTRRNFEGFRYMISESDWKLDLFTVNPVNSATGFRPVTMFNERFDSANRDVFFSGAYWTYTGIENTVVDLYYLWLEDERPAVARADGRRHTAGSRYARLFPIDSSRVWDLDLEGAYQFGSDNGQDVHAGFATAVLGHTWKDVTWSPRLSGLFYYGSGDTEGTDGTSNTFCVLFPLGHAYWSVSDNLAGQNLLDYALQADVKPTSKTAVTAAHHFFQLADDDDTAYNLGGAAFGIPGNGDSVGHALDLYGYYALNPNFDVQVGYSWFWYGAFIERTTPRGDATQLYIQTSVRY